MTSQLQDNLRFLCAEKPSTAQVCRDIGINPQQFSKYLTGRARASAHHLRRIAQYFGIEEDSLSGPSEALIKTYRRQSATRSERRKDPLATAFPGDLARLRPYLGAYQVVFRAPLAEDAVVINAVFLDERGGMVYSRLIEALKSNQSGTRRWTRCDGKVSYQGGRIFMVDHERQAESALSMHILTPPRRQKKTYLMGTMCYLASLPHRMPSASKVVWKKFDAYKSVRELLETCGVYAQDSLKLDPVIRAYLSEQVSDPATLI